MDTQYFECTFTLGICPQLFCIQCVASIKEFLNMSHEYLTWSSMCQAVTALMTLLSFFFKQLCVCL